MEILNKIQELDGKSLGDRYRTINEIINNASNKTDGTELLKSFIPKDNLEKKLWTKLLSKFPDKDLFMETMKSEDHELVELMFANGKWFFTMNNLTCDEILDNVFPNITTSLRIKFLQCVSKYYQQKDLENLFVAIREQYNLKWAFYLLSACSSEFIIAVLTEENMNVTEKLLLILYSNRPDVVKDYFNHLLTIEKLKYTINNYKKVLEKIALKEPNVFFDYYHTSDVIKPGVFGANTTKKLIETKKALILEKPKHYLGILHRRQLYASLNYSEYMKFYLGICPEEEITFVDRFSARDNVHSLLKYLKQRKLGFLFQAYKTLYKRELLDNKKMITETLMEILPIDLQAKCAAGIIDNQVVYENNWERWYCYYEPNIAIPKFKEFIYAANDAGKRLLFVQYMIRCCGNYKDYEKLCEVLKYILERHRNEDCGFRNTILQEICNKFTISQFNDDVWNYIDDFFRLFNLADEWGNIGHNNQIMKFIEGRLRYNLSKDLSIEEYIVFWIYFKSARWEHLFNILTDNIEYEKKCLECTGKLLPTKKNFVLSDMSSSMIASVANFNDRHPTEKITVLKYQWVVDYVKYIILLKDKISIDIIRCDLQKDHEAFEFFDIRLVHEITIHNLKEYMKKPDLIIEQYRNILNGGLTVYHVRHLLEFLKNRKFIYIPRLRSKIIEYCLDRFKNVKDSKIKSCALRVLANLIDYKTFYNLTNSYFPVDKIVDTKTHDPDTYAVQKAIGVCIGKYPGPQETYEALQIFCRGDYLKLTLGSLVSVCHKTNQNKALTFLNKNLDQPVSVRKHMIRLINSVGTKNALLKLLYQLWTNEKNPSIRNVIMTIALNCFASDPSAEIWNLLKNIFSELNVKDKDMFSTLLNFHSIQKIYLKDYIKTCWYTVIKLEKQDKIDFTSERCSLLNQISSNIEIFEEEYIEELIKQSFDSSHNDSIQTSYIKLFTFYLLKTDFDLNKKSTNFKMIIQDYVDKNWLKTDEDNFLTYPFRKTIISFLEQLCQEAIRSKDNPSTLKNFNQGLEDILKIFDPAQIFREYLELRLTQMYLKSNDTNDFIDRIKDEFFDVELKQYGPTIISYLTFSITSIIDTIQLHDNVKYSMRLARRLVEEDTTCHHHIAAIDLLNKSSNTRTVYEDIMKVLSRSTNRAVQVYLNNHLNIN